MHIVGASDCVLSDKVIRKLRYEELTSEPSSMLHYTETFGFLKRDYFLKFFANVKKHEEEN